MIFNVINKLKQLHSFLIKTRHILYLFVCDGQINQKVSIALLIDFCTIKICLIFFDGVLLVLAVLLTTLFNVWTGLNVHIR
jgi:hypothetical protein